MNADCLLALYKKVAEAPDAVPRLRRFVLDLAVRGKLVAQDADDEPASELQKRIAAEKARLVKAGRLGRKKAATPTSVEEDVELPSGWAAVYGLDLFPTRSGNSKLVKGRLHSEPADGLYPGFSAAGQDVWLDNWEHEGDAIILSAVGARCGKAFRATGKWSAVANTHIIWLLTNVTDPAFAMLHLNNEDFWLRSGGAQPFVKVIATLERPFPLPPLAEQRRIVAKVEELMALLDRLEVARAEREATRDRLTAASLARLTAPGADPAEFPDNARFTLATLSALTTRPDQIKPLRQTILNLAVRGKLVEQDPTDEPAPELIARMVKERKAIVAKRKIRGAKPPAPPSAEIEGLDLPPSWRLCSLGQITLITDPNPSHRYPDYSGGTVPILSTREFSGDNGWNPESAKLTTQAFWEFQKQICDFAEGDIIFARKGRLGLPRYLPRFEKYTFSHTLFSIKPMTGLYPAYLLWLLRRDEVVAWLTNEMNQNTGVPTLGKAKTERLPIPIPPLAEQRRIVAKVDALMTLCDRLEAALATADTTRARLLESLLHEALDQGAQKLEAAE